MQIGYKLSEAKKMFFDRPAVQKAADKATRKVLSKFGAFVRTTARQSIRSGKAPARRGEPPTSQTGLLKRFIYFGFDTPKASVVIGPILLTKDRSPDGKPIPQLLEEGGRAAYSPRRAKRKKRDTYKLSPRPYMGPAFAKELPKLPAMWRDSIR